MSWTTRICGSEEGNFWSIPDRGRRATAALPILRESPCEEKDCGLTASFLKDTFWGKPFWFVENFVGVLAGDGSLGGLLSRMRAGVFGIVAGPKRILMDLPWPGSSSSSAEPPSKNPEGNVSRPSCNLSAATESINSSVSILVPSGSSRNIFLTVDGGATCGVEIYAGELVIGVLTTGAGCTAESSGAVGPGTADMVGAPRCRPSSPITVVIFGKPPRPGDTDRCRADTLGGDNERAWALGAIATGAITGLPRMGLGCL